MHAVSFRKLASMSSSAPPGGPERGYGHLTLKPCSVLARIGGLGSVLYEYGAVAIYGWQGWICFLVEGHCKLLLCAV